MSLRGRDVCAFWVFCGKPYGQMPKFGCHLQHRVLHSVQNSSGGVLQIMFGYQHPKVTWLNGIAVGLVGLLNCVSWYVMTVAADNESSCCRVAVTEHGMYQITLESTHLTK